MVYWIDFKEIIQKFRWGILQSAYIFDSVEAALKWLFVLECVVSGPFGSDRVQEYCICALMYFSCMLCFDLMQNRFLGRCRFVPTRDGS